MNNLLHEPIDRRASKTKIIGLPDLRFGAPIFFLFSITVARPSNFGNLGIFGRSVSGEITELVLFAQTVLIKLALPQAAWLNVYLLENQKFCTLLRDLN